MCHCQRTFIPDPARQWLKGDKLSDGLEKLGTTGDQGMLKSRTGALPPRADMYYMFPEPLLGLRGQQWFSVLSEHSSSCWHVRRICARSFLAMHGCITANGDQHIHNISESCLKEDIKTSNKNEGTAPPPPIPEAN